MTAPIGDATVGSLHVALERASRRAAMVASNIANLDTPGYRSADIVFSDTLGEASASALERTDPKHLGAGGGFGDDGFVVQNPADRIRNDGNTVDVDREMTLLTALQQRYQTAAELVRKRFALIVYSVTDGRNGS